MNDDTKNQITQELAELEQEVTATRSQLILIAALNRALEGLEYYKNNFSDGVAMHIEKVKQTMVMSGACSYHRRPKWQRIGNEIDAAFIFARA